ncbi:MAG: hypothetical protein WAN46_14665 [Gammaproteobacteria bacterium]
MRLVRACSGRGWALVLAEPEVVAASASDTRSRHLHRGCAVTFPPIGIDDTYIRRLSIVKSRHPVRPLFEGKWDYGVC